VIGSERGPAARSCLLALATLLLAPATATAKLVLRDPAARTITLVQLQHGKRIVVCNQGDAPARRIHVRFQHVALTQRGTSVGTDKVLASVVRRRTLAPGACGALHVALRSGISLDERQTTGALAVTSTAGELRLPLTLDAGADSAVTPAQGADATIELRGRRDNPIHKHTRLIDGAVLALHVAQRGRSPAVNPTGVLGTVVHDAQRAVIRATGPPRLDPDDESVWLLPVTADGLSRPGTYSGTLDISGAGDATSAIRVDVSVTDAWRWPAAAVLGGALAAFLGQLWVGNWRIRRRFRRRRKRLAKAYQDAEVGLAASLPVGSQVQRPTDDDVARYAELVKQQTKAAFWWGAVIDPKSPAYTGIDDSLRRAERDAACLTSSEGRVSELARRLAKLDATARELVAFANERCARKDVPGVVQRAIVLVTGGLLDVGGALKLVDVAERHLAYMRRWRQLIERALEYERWWHELSVRLTLPIQQGGMEPADRRRLLRVGTILHQAENELYLSRDQAALDRHATESKLDGVYERLSRLRTLHWLGGRPDVTSAAVRARLDAAGIVYSWPHLGQTGDDDDYTITIEDPDADVSAATVEPATPVRVVKGLRVFDIVVLVFSVAVGLVVVLGQLYFGKTFGSTEDYLTAVAAGAGSQLLVSGLVTTLGNMHATDGDPISVSDAAAATLHINAP